MIGGWYEGPVWYRHLQGLLCVHQEEKGLLSCPVSRSASFVLGLETLIESEFLFSFVLVLVLVYFYFNLQRKSLTLPDLLFLAYNTTF